MPGLPSVHLMLSQELGQMIFDADKKEEFNGIVDLERITALAEEQHKKWPVIPSPQFPHPRTSTDCIEYGPLIFGNSGRPIAHCTVKAGIVCPVEHVGKHKADPKPVLVWVKDRAGTVVAGMEIGEEYPVVISFPKPGEPPDAPVGLGPGQELNPGHCNGYGASGFVYTGYALYEDGDVFASAPTPL